MPEPGELNRQQFADFCGVSASAITRAYKEGRVRRTDGNLYSIYDATNREYIRLALTREAKQRRKDGERTADVESDESEKLEAEKTREEIKRIREQRVGFEIRNAQNRRDLVPFQDVRMWLGAFAGGIRNNFLRLGDRIARGDKKLRDKVETEVQKSIQKTLDNAAAQLREHIKDVEDIVSDD